MRPDERSSAATTRSVQVPAYGGPEVLTLVRTARAPLPLGHVRVRVRFAGVNFADVHQRTGRYPVRLPFVLGSEGSGRVVERAADVRRIEVGHRVAWQGVQGSYADEVVVPADKLIAVPLGLGDEQAAALPLQGLTAHYLATSSYPVQAGDTVLVHAGAGGVGMLVTQVARLRGARVIATAGDADKMEVARSVGADHVLGYEDFPRQVRKLTGGRGVQAVYDGVGRSTFDGSLDVLDRRGTLVLFGAASGAVPPFDLDRLRVSGSLTITRPTLRDFVADPAELQTRAAELMSWVTAGTVKMTIGRRYPLEDAVRAHRDLESRRTTGKLLLHT